MVLTFVSLREIEKYRITYHPQNMPVIIAALRSSLKRQSPSSMRIE